MTKVKMLYNNNVLIGFKMEGHAEYNTKGYDILCASLSSISQMTMNGILDWTGLDTDDTVLEQNQEYAILRFEVPYKYTSIVTGQLFRSFEMYVEQLSDMYSNHVKLERCYKND